ncbi:hydroxyproline-2-epimerase [Advenella kashmirensis W13003]|uniref:Hydroxyproline-2-epimerase n=1 Tax=Advenella kashmirensis W13003 TaxID=1424334 RepID=V8QYS4_9BURK|nr:4-hydroxyproline epimerase [Advenella kashmirensis]ETF04169.1 hydroxyproline-2-epimerase [Advenella kashmirensis W13003]
MQDRYQKLQVIDSHTEGEPTRMIYQGFPDLGKGSMAEKLETFKSQHDALRRAIILEPRGNDILVGALLCEPVNPKATAGVIFFNNSGYLGMCGHGTIGLVASLAYLGRIQSGEHLIETPVGDVHCTLHEDGSVSVRNVRSWRYRKAVTVQVPDIGPVTGDIAWGGNWFFLVSQKLEDICLENADRLTQISWAIRQALKTSGVSGQDGGEIDHIELFGETDKADSQSFVLCPGKAYDRSPCGTGTSAKLACLAADQQLQPGQIWRQASVISSQFTAYYHPADTGQGIIPVIRGNAYICAENCLVLDQHDPFKFGITAS